MSVLDEALELEAKLPRMLGRLFGSGDDQLRAMPVSQIRIVRALTERDKTASELCRELDLSPSSLSQMADRLAKAGFLLKEVSPEDKRFRKFALSAYAKEMMTKRREARAKSASIALAALSPAERAMLLELIEKLTFAALEAKVESSRAAV